MKIEEDLRKELSSAHDLSINAYLNLQNRFQRFSQIVFRIFTCPRVKRHPIQEFHGQTILHDPQSGLTEQMINGGLIASKTGLKIVCDFRRADVALSGQGAPLVPIGDRDLFGEYEACLNLGGFANISLTEKAIELHLIFAP